MNKPYIRNCQVCEKDFCTADPKAKYHLGCKPDKKRCVYPKEFYKKKHIAWIRDDQVCQLCEFDFKDDGKDVCKHIHHIDQNTKNNNINNLVVLCAKCHRRVHSGILEGKFKFKKDFKPKKYPKLLPKVEKFYFKGLNLEKRKYVFSNK
jgi:5-methylcytosine-specific restriction endonuclease McrA